MRVCSEIDINEGQETCPHERISDKALEQCSDCMLDRLRDLIGEFAGPGESLIGVVLPRVLRLLDGAKTEAEFYKAQRDTAWRDKGEYFGAILQVERRSDALADENERLKGQLALFTQRLLTAPAEVTP